MKCPVCPDTNLLMTERQGIEIDYCPQCRGVWLDRGELDKIIERSMREAAPVAVAPAPAPAPAAQPNYQAPQQFGYGHHDKHHHDKHHDSHHGYHGKHSFWKELFD